MLLVPVLALAQSEPSSMARGVDVFNKSCATGYCHGEKGMPGGAPRLAARGFDDAYISQTVRGGITGTGMPAFGMTLDRADLLGVIAYVDSLNGVTPPPNPFAAGPDRRRLAPEAQRGRQLFADQVRAFARCSACHQADGIGIGVAAPFSSIPESVAALRRIATPQIETALAEGDSFPTLVLNKSGALTKLYDLKTMPPVLRTFPKSTVTLQNGSTWRHEAMLASYNDQELDSILVFLRAVVKP